LPHPAKPWKVAIFADGAQGFEAKKLDGVKVYSTEDINAMAADKKKANELLDYALLASTPLMAVVGKNFGQLLATKGRLPKPLPPNANIKELVDRTSRSVILKVKGKNLPVVHCIVGTEAMTPADITENIMTILEALEKKVTENQVKSVFVKTTMGKAIKVLAQ